MIWERGEGSSFTVRMPPITRGVVALAILVVLVVKIQHPKGRNQDKKRLLMQQLGQDFVFSNNLLNDAMDFMVFRRL